MKVITNLWGTEKIFNEWTNALIWLLHRKGGKADAKKYLDISLL